MILLTRLLLVIRFLYSRPMVVILKERVLISKVLTRFYLEREFQQKVDCLNYRASTGPLQNHWRSKLCFLILNLNIFLYAKASESNLIENWLQLFLHFIYTHKMIFGSFCDQQDILFRTYTFYLDYCTTTRPI